MSDYIDTREGWRYIGKEQIPDGVESIVHATGPGAWESWVRKAPVVPPLPTEPYTVIRVTWKTGARQGARDVLTLHDEESILLWVDTEGTAFEHEGTLLRDSITSFEILAEPRAVTARALLDRVRKVYETNGAPVVRILDQVAREFEEGQP